MNQQFVQRTSLLPAFPECQPWRGLSAESKSCLLGGASLFDLERGESPNCATGVVTSGVLGIRHDLSDGRRILSALYRPGAFVDLRRSGRREQGILIALAAAKFLALDGRALDRAVTERREVAAALAGQLREHCAALRDHAADLTNKTPMEKIAALIFEFARHCGGPADQGPQKRVAIHLRRTDIADYIGVKPETVSRVVRRLKKEGLIALPDPDHIELLDRPALRQIANGGRPRRSTRGL